MVLSLILISYFSKSVLALCFYYFLYSWIIGNVRRISGGRKALIIRRMIYFLPLLLPFLFVRHTYGNLKLNLIGFIAMSTISGFILFLRRKENRVLFNKDFVLYIKREEQLENCIISLIFLIAMSIAEELFFRGVVYSLFQEKIILCFLISTILFFLHHYSVLWSSSTFNRKDYLYQLIFATFSMLSLILTNNILTSILGHLLMNLPFIYSESILLISKLKKEESIEY